MKAEILFENENVLIYNKPTGMLVIPDRFDESIPVLKRIAEQYIGHKIWVLHRIDKGTSGVIAFAKNEAAHKFFSLQFQNHEAIKHYEALVSGYISEHQITIETPINAHPTIKGKMMVTKKGKASKTELEVLKQWPLYAHIRVRIHSGRTHQIRVHMASIGHPVLVDELYGDGKPLFLSQLKKKYKQGKYTEEEKPLLNRLALHAVSLTLWDEQHQPISATAPLPKDMRAFIAQLNKNQPS